MHSPLALRGVFFAWSGRRLRITTILPKAAGDQQPLHYYRLLLLNSCGTAVYQKKHHVLLRSSSQCVRAAVVHGDQNLLPARHPSLGHPGLALVLCRQLHGLIYFCSLHTIVLVYITALRVADALASEDVLVSVLSKP